MQDAAAPRTANVAWVVATIVGSVVYVLTDVLGRIVPGLAWLVPLPVGVLSACGVTVLIWRIKPVLLVPTLVGPVLGIVLLGSLLAAFQLPLMAHFRLGTPSSTDCDWPGVRTTSCRERNFGFMQARKWVSMTVGTMEASDCEGFFRAATHLTGSHGGPGEPAQDHPCTAGKPENWYATRCDELQSGTETRCALCRRWSSTNDGYYQAYLADESCTHVRVLQSVGVGLSVVERCLDPFLGCPNDRPSWGDPAL